MERCTIGTQLELECHKNTWCKRSGLLNISSFDKTTLDLLECRTGLFSIETGTICFHHEKEYLSRYESLQKYCCDPFNKHTQKNIK